MGDLSGLGSYVAKGKVTIASNDDIGTEAQFTDLYIDSVEDPRAYLTTHGDLSSRLPIGKLPQSEGSFNIMISADVDVSKYNAVLIYCRKAKENIGLALIH